MAGHGVMCDEKTDAEKVAEIERRHELELLDRLLEERTRPVPPPGDKRWLSRGKHRGTSPLDHGLSSDEGTE